MRAGQLPKRTLEVAPEVACAPGAEALHGVLSNLAATGEAFRLGIIGTTGTGKTTAAREVVLGFLRASRGLVVVADAKAEKRFDDLLPPDRVAVREAVSELAADAKPLVPGQRLVILRPRVYEDREVDTEEVARYCLRLAGRSPACPTLNVNDEFVPHAAEFGQYAGGKKSTLRKAFTQGRTMGRSQLWGAHDLTDVPVSTISNSRLWVFHLAGTGLEILRRRNYLIGMPDGLLESLPDDESPQDERGWFAELRGGKPWNRKLFRF